MHQVHTLFCMRSGYLNSDGLQASALHIVCSCNSTIYRVTHDTLTTIRVWEITIPRIRRARLLSRERRDLNTYALTTFS